MQSPIFWCLLIAVIVAICSSTELLRRPVRAVDPRACFARSTVTKRNLDYIEDNVEVLAYPNVATEQECADKCLNAAAFLNAPCHSYRFQDLTPALTNSCVLRATYVMGNKVQYTSAPITVIYGNRTSSCPGGA